MFAKNINIYTLKIAPGLTLKPGLASFTKLRVINLTNQQSKSSDTTLKFQCGFYLFINIPETHIESSVSQKAQDPELTITPKQFPLAQTLVMTYCTTIKSW